MKMIKKFVAVAVIAAMSLSVSACGNQKADSADPVVATVGDVKIRKADLERTMYQVDYYAQMQYGEDYKTNPDVVPMYNQMLDQNLDQLINDNIMVLKAKERKDIEVTDEEVEKELKEVKDSCGSDESYSSALSQIGVTEKEFKENLEKNLYCTKLFDAYKQEASVTDEEIKDYYDQNVANYTKKSGANISHILVDSEDKAKEILQLYKNGAKFEDLAKQYGTDGTKDSGGSLGYVEYDTQQYDQDFMAAAKQLGEGEVSDPVKTQFGWHLIKVDGIQKEDKVQSIDEVKADIKDQLVSQKANEALTKDIENWRKDYTIKTYKEKYQLEVPAASSDSSSSDSSDASSDASESTASESPAAESDASSEASK